MATQTKSGKAPSALKPIPASEREKASVEITVYIEAGVTLHGNNRLMRDIRAAVAANLGPGTTVGVALFPDGGEAVIQRLIVS